MDIMLEKIVKSFRVSGREDQIRNIIREELNGIDCEIKEDCLGNLIVKMGKGEEKIIISANMDVAGFMVTYIEDSGKVRVNAVGEIKANQAVNNLVVFESGIVGRVSSSKNNPEIDDLYIDLGLNCKDEVIKNVKEGHTACLLSSGFEAEDRVVSLGLNNAVGCYTLLKLIKEVKEFNKEVYFVFASQGELGGRGARAAAYEIKPNKAVVLSVQECKDNVEMGKGPVIRIKDRSLLMCQDIKEMLEKAAEKVDVKVQYGIGTEGTDGGLIHKEVGGISTGVAAIPIKYNHTQSEMVDMKDVNSMIGMIKNIL